MPRREGHCKGPSHDPTDGMLSPVVAVVVVAIVIVVVAAAAVVVAFVFPAAVVALLRLAVDVVQLVVLLPVVVIPFPFSCVAVVPTTVVGFFLCPLFHVLFLLMRMTSLMTVMLASPETHV